MDEYRAIKGVRPIDALFTANLCLTRNERATVFIRGAKAAKIAKGQVTMVPASSSRTLITQTCLGLGGLFYPTIRPLFQAGRSARMSGEFGVSRMEPSIHYARS